MTPPTPMAPPAPPHVNPFVAATASPPIPEVQAWARQYDGSRGHLLDLAQAAPAHPPHPGLLGRLADAAGSPAGAQYGPICGDPGLRAAYAADLGRAYGARLGPDDVAVTAGCNLAFFATAMTVARRGDCVLLPSPWYFNHQMTLELLGVEVRPLPCRSELGFVPNPADARALLDGRVRAVVLVSPNNPTGAVYPPEVIAAFAELCRRERIFLILDETYRDFLPPGTARPHDLFADDDWRGTAVQLYSFSKSYAVPGHRAGAIAAGAPLVAQLAKVLDCLQICPPRAAQAALAWAIPALGGWREGNRAEINRRVAAFRAALAPLGGWRVESAGAYFAYLAHPFVGRSAREVAERLATERGVLCLPGSFFGPGQEGHLRVAVANVSVDALVASADRFRGLSP